jgi:hypothetical protein
MKSCSALLDVTSPLKALLSYHSLLAWTLSRVVVAIEFSGILGEYTSLPDAMNAQMVLVKSLMNDTSYCAVKLDNVADRNIAVLRAPHFVGKGNCDSL